MSPKRKYSVIVTPDDDGERFSLSNCNCDVCKSMHNSQVEWDSFIPTTKLQYRMKRVIEKLENDENNVNK